MEQHSIFWGKSPLSTWFMFLVIGSAVMALLPKSPFLVMLKYTYTIPEMRYWAWVVPIRETIVMYETFLAAVGIWYSLKFLLRETKIMQ